MQNPLNLLHQIREDFITHGSDPTKPGFQALAAHRFGTWTRTIKSRSLRIPFSVAHKIAFVFTRNFYGIELPVEAKIGRRVVFEHQHGIVIHGNCVIGDDCVLRQGCTLGMRTVDKPHEAPRLGCGVNIGCGAAILGNVQVGDYATIGSNAVVTKDVRRGSYVVGNNKVLSLSCDVGNNKVLSLSCDDGEYMNSSIAKSFSLVPFDDEDAMLAGLRKNDEGKWV